jgi:hypothetical protein
MKAPPRPLSQKRAAEGLQGRVRRARLYVLSQQQVRRGSLPTFLFGTTSLLRELPVTVNCVCVFITAGPIIKLCAGGEGDSEGHVL